MHTGTFDDIAARVAALPADTKISSMWRLMRQLSRSSLSGAHAVVFLAVYGRVRASRAVPTIEIGELAIEVGVSCAAISDLIADLEMHELVMIDDGRGATVRVTIPSLINDRSTIGRRSSMTPEARVLH